MTENEIGGLQAWNEGLRGDEIPGSTRVPVIEIYEHFKGNTNNLKGLDLGSGQGRSTKVLKEKLKGSDITALDLSTEGLKLTETENRIQALGQELPFEQDSFDFVNVCGVMTNLVSESPENAVRLRGKVLKGLFNVIKPGGCVVISDFGANHEIDDYDVNYDRHALITGEKGTIAVLKSGENFVGKNNEEVAAMKGTKAIERFAHHFTPGEMSDLLQNAGFTVEKYSVEVGQTPKGKKSIENLIVVGKKLEKSDEMER